METEILIGEASLTIALGENKYSLQKNGYYYCKEIKKYLHRMVYETAFPGQAKRLHVHHINGKKTDNRIENLMALKPGVHKRLHEEFTMQSLPARESIEEWIKTIKVIDRIRFKRLSKKQRKNIRKAYNRKKRALTRVKTIEKPKLEYYGPPKPKKIFIARYIVRKAIK